MELFVDEKLIAPDDAFWEPDFSLRSESYNLEKLDKICPWKGKYDFNPIEQVWHGMGGGRDYNYIYKTIGLYTYKQPVEVLIHANEDAKEEGILWIEYFDCHYEEETQNLKYAKMRNLEISGVMNLLKNVKRYKKLFQKLGLLL